MLQKLIYAYIRATTLQLLYVDRSTIGTFKYKLGDVWEFIAGACIWTGFLYAHYKTIGLYEGMSQLTG